MYTREDLETKTLADLKKIAKQLGIKGYSTWKATQREQIYTTIVSTRDDDDEKVVSPRVVPESTPLTREELEALTMKDLKAYGKSLNFPKVHTWRKNTRDEHIQAILGGNVRIVLPGIEKSEETIQSLVMKLYNMLTGIPSIHQRRELVQPILDIIDERPGEEKEEVYPDMMTTTLITVETPDPALRRLKFDATPVENVPSSDVFELLNEIQGQDVSEQLELQDIELDIKKCIGVF